MNPRCRFFLAFALLGATPVFAAKSTGKPSTPMPSVHLRQMIDKTLPKISTITNPKKTFNRTALTTAQADFTAKALTAAPALQPMYQAAQMVIANLVGAVAEHEKAVADFQYSKNLHGAQERENEDISNARQHSGTAFANNQKQNKENADSRKALLDKGKFLSNGTIATWTQRVGQLHELIEQSYAAELVAEKQLAMLTLPAAPPTAAPKPAPKLKEPSAAEQYSPVGVWKSTILHYRSPTLKEDYTTVAGKYTGTWKWTDQSKRTLSIIWTDGLTMDLNFSADGRTLIGKSSNGHDANFARGN